MVSRSARDILSALALLAASVVIGIQTANPPSSVIVSLPPDLSLRAHCEDVASRAIHRWKILPVKLEIDGSVPESARVQLRLSVEDWNTALGGIKAFELLEPRASEVTTVSRNSRVYWVRSHWPYERKYIGMTVSEWNSDDTFLTTDVLINNHHYTFKDVNWGSSRKAKDLRTLFVHELGHALGLGHIKGSTMNEYLLEMPNGKEVGEKEKISISCLYADLSESLQEFCFKRTGFRSLMDLQ